MKRLLVILIFLLSCRYTANAENVIIGDKLPEMQLRAWLMDTKPVDKPLSCILFHHTESDLCCSCLEQVKQLVYDYSSNINLVIITKEEYAKAGVALTEHLCDNVGVAFDDKGLTFRAFGVSFIPFCVICDDKNRAVWCGNGMTLDKEIIKNILTTKSK